MIHDAAWLRWVMASARSWRDIEGIVPETGIDLVDDDHRSLLEFVVELNLLAEDSGDGFSSGLLERQRSLLRSLLEYTKRHFDREERLIESLGTANLERQRSEHGRIVAALEERTRDFAAGRVSISPELRRSIFSWIVDHIAGTDMETFRLVNLEDLFARASSWKELRGIIRTTGVDLLDSEHRALVDAILEAIAALHAGSADFPLRMERLRQISRDHFTDEEDFMLRYGVSGLPEQKTAHERFLSLLEQVSSDCQDSETLAACATETARRLIAWLVDHVNRLDYLTFRRSDWQVRAFESLGGGELLPLVRATGIAAVDADHREFILMASSFGDAFSAAKKGGDVHALASRFDDLIAFASRHFDSEEKLFPETVQARAPRHASEHRDILATLTAYRARLAEGRIGAATAARSIVLGWWVNHTNGTDVETFGSHALDGEAAHG